MRESNKVINFLCIDVGTTRFKTAIINSMGDIIVKKDYRYYKNQLSRNFRFHYYDKKAFFDAFKISLEGIKNEYNINNISAIGITGHGQTLIPIGKGIIPIQESFGYLDERTTPYTEFVKKNIQDDPISLMYIPIALFYKKEFSPIYKRIKTFLTPTDYISFLLTEKYFTSVSSPTIEPWKKNILKKFGLDNEKFPDFIYMGQKIGNTTSRAKKLFEIPENIPVIAMGGDFAMGELGTGTIELGNAFLRFGTSAGINMCWNKQIIDKRLLSYRHFIKGLWNISAMINTAGISIDWAMRILNIKDIPEKLNLSIKNLIFFPYLKGEKTPLWNPNLTASLIGITSKTNNLDILTSIIIGIAMGINEGIKIMENNGVKFNKPIVASGWWTGINWFMQMISDVTGKKYSTVNGNDAELIGIAIVLSKALGIYPDIKAAIRNMIQYKNTFEPELKIYQWYNRYYKKYKLLRDKLYSYIAANL